MDINQTAITNIACDRAKIVELQCNSTSAESLAEGGVFKIVGGALSISRVGNSQVEINEKGVKCSFNSK